MPHKILGLGWDEWASIATIGTVFWYIFKELLKRYVELPMMGIRNDLKQSHKLQKENLAVLERRANQHERQLQQHELQLREQKVKIEDLERR